MIYRIIRIKFKINIQVTDVTEINTLTNKPILLWTLKPQSAIFKEGNTKSMMNGQITWFLLLTFSSKGGTSTAPKLHTVVDVRDTLTNRCRQPFRESSVICCGVAVEDSQTTSYIGYKMADDVTPVKENSIDCIFCFASGIKIKFNLNGSKCSNFKTVFTYLFGNEHTSFYEELTANNGVICRNCFNFIEKSAFFKRLSLKNCPKFIDVINRPKKGGLSFLQIYLC